MTAGPSLVEAFAQRAAARPDDVAVRYLIRGEVDETSLTIGELHRRSLAVSFGLRALGLAGARVVICLPSGLDFAETFVGCLYAGAIPVPIATPKARDKSNFTRIEGIVGDCEAAALVCSEPIRDTLAAAGLPQRHRIHIVSPDQLRSDAPRGSGEPSPGDVAFLQYTSGSTAFPRGVAVTHDNLKANVAAFRSSMRIDDTMTFVSWLPLHHDMGLIGMLLHALYAGNPLVLMSPQHFLQRPLRWLEAISRFGPVLSGGPNFAYDLCVRRASAEALAGLDLSGWRVAFNGAEPVRAATLAGFAETFAGAGLNPAALFPCYGLAECTLFAAGGFLGEGACVSRFDKQQLQQRRAVAPSSASAAIELVGCGGPAAGHRVEIVEPRTRAPLPAGEVGEVLLSGPSVARGYWRADSAADPFAATIPGQSDRFLATGDLGFVWEDRLFLSGRLKDLIVVRGRNIYPQDIELTVETLVPPGQLGGCAAFAEAANGEEKLIVVVELKRVADHPLLPAEIVRRVFEDHDIRPWQVIFAPLGAIPRTSSGKLRRQACRQALADDELPVLAKHWPVASPPALVYEFE